MCGEVFLYENVWVVSLSEIFFKFVELSWCEMSVMVFLFDVLVIIGFFIFIIKRNSINFFVFCWGVFVVYIIVFSVIC